MAKADPEIAISGDKALAGVLALLVAEREERLTETTDPRKTEVVLAQVGLAPNEIAAVMGKNIDAVRKAIQRGRR